MGTVAGGTAGMLTPLHAPNEALEKTMRLVFGFRMLDGIRRPEGVLVRKARDGVGRGIGDGMRPHPGLLEGVVLMMEMVRWA
jgi:hypothetical protein